MITKKRFISHGAFKTIKIKNGVELIPLQLRLRRRLTALLSRLRKEHICPACGRDKRTMANMGGFDMREIVLIGFPVNRSFHRRELCNYCNPIKMWTDGKIVIGASIMGGLWTYRLCK